MSLLYWLFLNVKKVLPIYMIDFRKQLRRSKDILNYVELERMIKVQSSSAMSSWTNDLKEWFYWMQLKNPIEKTECDRMRSIFNSHLIYSRTGARESNRLNGALASRNSVRLLKNWTRDRINFRRTTVSPSWKI